MLGFLLQGNTHILPFHCLDTDLFWLWSSEPEGSKKEHIIPFSVSFKIKALGYKDVFLNSSTPYSEISIRKQHFGWGAQEEATRALCRVGHKFQWQTCARGQEYVGYKAHRGKVALKWIKWIHGELDRVKGIEVEDSNMSKKSTFRKRAVVS